MRDCAPGIRMSIGTPEAIDQMVETWNRYGSDHDPASVNWCRRSFGVGPYSRPRSFGSIGPFENGI